MANKGYKDPTAERKRKFRLSDAMNLALSDYQSLGRRHGLSVEDAEAIRDSIENGKWRVVGESVKEA